MQSNLLWAGREYYSLENCLVNTTDEGSEIDSIIVGRYEEKIYRVAYKIKTNQHWETIYFEIHSQHSDQRKHILFESDGKGNWKVDGKHADQFKGCIDVDIPLTPFTNTLPINRLKFAPGEERQIQVIYVNLLEQQIIPVKQKYIRLSKNEYHYENIPNDFEAKIEVDELGFVDDYPSLFVRSAILMSNYH
ncbi:putative glycolipid-binding domain-containing protein [Chryseolinea sp. H1M3-3]|uniref:putative glycolipid-binding domain-containing protein n=1 Tax=Chryseolinea sp. H1M3-3 TaxID=3034144 RepID=UPI0023EA8928|nr:putative glycolipid-binding domain-containing protein [Chryseolinea sp. H1M3-3]